MKKFFLIASLMIAAISANAQGLDAKYCMNYADFVANRWTPIDSLTGGRTKQVCQLKYDGMQYRVKTGDKAADEILKKQVLAVEYGGHIYVNCKNLRVKDIPLEVSNYAQAYRYDKNKLCVVAHYTNDAAFLAGIAGDIVAIASPLPYSIPAFVASEALWIGVDQMSSYRCYILDQDANAKGKLAITRITDEQMEKTLANTPNLLERYKSVQKKGARQSAANIMPFLIEKGLITDSKI